MEFTLEQVVALLGDNQLPINEMYHAVFYASGHYEDQDEYFQGGWFIESRDGERLPTPYKTYKDAIHGFDLESMQWAFICSNLTMVDFLKHESVTFNDKYLSMRDFSYELTEKEDALLAHRDGVWVDLTEEEKVADHRGLPNIFRDQFDMPEPIPYCPVRRCYTWSKLEDDTDWAA